jgi:crotonobetainyl-CoA:carnitine CoA-transferase CaiB-like acyl-CoA transferase
MTDSSTATPLDAARSQRKYSQAELDEEISRQLAFHKREGEELRARAERAEALQARAAELEELTAAEQFEQRRAQIAADYGVSPEDAAILMSGADDTTLIAQAQRLAQRQQRTALVVPREGSVREQEPRDQDARDFVRDLFGGTE